MIVGVCSIIRKSIANNITRELTVRCLSHAPLSIVRAIVELFHDYADYIDRRLDSDAKIFN